MLFFTIDYLHGYYIGNGTLMEFFVGNKVDFEAHSGNRVGNVMCKSMVSV